MYWMRPVSNGNLSLYVAQPRIGMDSCYCVCSLPSHISFHHFIPYPIPAIRDTCVVFRVHATIVMGMHICKNTFMICYCRKKDKIRICSTTFIHHMLLPDKGHPGCIHGVIHILLDSSVGTGFPKWTMERG